MLTRAVALCLLACSANAASPSDKSWKNLGHRVKKTSYTAAIRDGRCITGRIESFNNKSVTIASIKVDRRDVLRLGDTIADHDQLYSGRSSWADLSNSEPNQYEQIDLEFKTGQQSKCRKFEADGDKATCDGNAVAKADVLRGYYIRLAPATDWEHYVFRENVPFLAPRVWFNLAFYPRIKVLLYDTSQPEENFPMQCKLQPN